MPNLNKFNKQLFSEILNKAKGTRSINQYALHTGVSSAHISRLLRQLLDTPPNPDIISKLVSKAQNNVTYEDLMQAAGHIPMQLKKDANELTDEFINLLIEHKKIKDISELTPQTALKILSDIFGEIPFKKDAD